MGIDYRVDIDESRILAIPERDSSVGDSVGLHYLRDEQQAGKLAVWCLRLRAGSPDSESEIGTSVCCIGRIYRVRLEYAEVEAQVE